MCDWYIPLDQDVVLKDRPTEYIYKMIETLLPKSEMNPEDKQFKLVELWAID